jgi:histidinol-phosphate aminotransferase
MMKAKDTISQLKPYQPGKSIDDVKREHNLTKVIKLASNENVYGCSPNVRQKLMEFGQSFEFYPDGYAEKLRVKLANKLNVEMDQLIFGSGSDEIVQMISRTFLEGGTNTVMAWPTFPQYRHHAKIEGAEIKEVPLQDGHHDLEKMLAAIDEHTRIVWLCTPNNPTGCYISGEKLMHFIQSCPKDVLLVIDEAYYEYVMAEDYIETIPLLQANENILILRTFSKAYGLAGLRVGYGIGSKDIVNKLNTVRGPFNVTSIGQVAAFHAFDDQQYINEIRHVNYEARRKLETFCKEINLTYDHSETNFLLIHLPISGVEVADSLLANGFIVRAGELIGVPNSIRVTIGKEEDMQEFMELLKKLVPSS